MVESFFADYGAQFDLHPVMAGQQLSLELDDFVLELFAGLLVKLVTGIDQSQSLLSFVQLGVEVFDLFLACLHKFSDLDDLPLVERRWRLGLLLCRCEKGDKRDDCGENSRFHMMRQVELQFEST